MHFHFSNLSSRHFFSHTLKDVKITYIPPHCDPARKNNRASSRSRRHVSNERANVHKNVRGVSESLNHRLLFRRGIDEPTESFSINHRRIEENKKHEESREQ